MKSTVFRATARSAARHMARASKTTMAATRRAAGSGQARLTTALGGATRTRVIVTLACVLSLSSADVATVGASATELRQALHIGDTDLGLLVTVTSLVAAVANLPFGVLADRVRRTWTLAGAITLWGGAMIWSATAGTFGELLTARLVLGIVTAAAGPLIASLTGDYFPGDERGRIYGYILAGELIGAGLGFGFTGDIAALSWRAAFIILAIPAFMLAFAVARLPEPARGGLGELVPENVQGQNGAADRVPRQPEPGGPEQGAPTPPHGTATDAQHLAAERGFHADPALVLRKNPRRMTLLEATRYVLRIRTNVVLIIASSCGYFFLSGIEVFGSEFARGQYRVNLAVANLVLLILGVGAIGGVLSGGAIGDVLLRRRHLNGRITVSAIAATTAVILFIPALFTRNLVAALPYLVFAAFGLSAQNPPLDAARLDIMPPLLWGRAEAVRSLIRSAAQALAPLAFGFAAQHVFGGGRTGLQWTLTVMLLPLAASAFLLFRSLRTYAGDVATAAAAPPPHVFLRPAARRPGTARPAAS